MRWWDRFIEYIQAHAGAWTVIFTFLLTVCTGLLIWVGHQANNNNVVTQRAFMNFQNIQLGIRNTTPDGKTIISALFGAGWTNSGSTPAVRVHTRVNYLPYAGELQSGFNFPDRDSGPPHRLVVGPRASVTIGPVEVMMHDLEEVYAGHTHLYFYGWMTYDDTFTKQRHLTEYCEDISVRPQTGTDLRNPAIAWLVQFTGCGSSVEHSCYDKDCTDYSEAIGR
jgi:hypothetical protein